MSYFLSIVIPAFNEAKRITRSLEDLKNFFPASDQRVEIILVIEKSTDKSVALAHKVLDGDERFTIIANEVHLGKGYAVRTGMLRTRGEFVFFMDLDLSTPLVEVFRFLAHFEQNPSIDILIGSRQHPDTQLIKKQHPIRQKMGSTFNFFVQLFALKGIKDTQCGFKAFRQKTVKPIFTRAQINGFSFDVEILLLAQALGYSIEPLGVKWINAPDSKVRIIRDSFKMLCDVMRLKSIVRKSILDKPQG
jgi:dolichyl-phosphate beta-glucosyltransferase